MPPTVPDNSAEVMKNPGVRPSPITSQPTVSTGLVDVDKILQHNGMPTGNGLLIEESGTTDFAAVLLRAFVSQGVMHNRVGSTVQCHSIVVGLLAAWAKDLPGLYKGSSKDQKKQKIREHESKLSVANVTDNDMKIAWRYGIKKREEGPRDEPHDDGYTHQFDITQKLVPGPGPQDILFVPLAAAPHPVLAQVRHIITVQLKQSRGRVVRVAVPNLLNPSIYSPAVSTPQYVIPLVHGLRELTREFGHNVVVMASIPLDLYPRVSAITLTIESLSDGVLHLQPFNQDMMALIEKAYKNEPAKIQQGLVNIIKVPVLSERGMMMVYDGEYAFRNGRKRFDIEEWGIPVEDEPDEKPIDF